MDKRIIYGGNFINKGAEALTRTTVEMLKNKYPGDEPVLLDLFPTQFGADRHRHGFKIINMHVRTLYRMHFPILKLFFKQSSKSSEEKNIKSLFNQAAGFYDISGYGISSHNQNPMWTLATMIPAFWAAKRNIPVVLLPQSLGPFDYKGWKKLILKPIVARYLKIPKTIFIRESVSRSYLAPFRTDGIIDSFDLVLLNPIRLQDKTEPGAIALIPNRQLTNFMPWGDVAKLFASLADKAIARGHSIHIFAHAGDDKKLCADIYDAITKKKDVIHYQTELNVPETEILLSRMQAVITARYHGLVHAYKQGKPCFTIGWATKYRSLIEAMEQQNFYADLSEEHDATIIALKFNNWLEKGLHDGPSIKQSIQFIQEESQLMNYL